MLDMLANLWFFKRLRKTRFYCRVRQRFPWSEWSYISDFAHMADANAVSIDWPSSVPKPVFGIIRDHERCPRWTKYCRFLDANSFSYRIYDIHGHDWLNAAADFDVIVGMPSGELHHLLEIRRKFHVVETYLGKACYPTAAHVLLYEDKFVEAFIARAHELPFANTYVSNDKTDAMRMVDDLNYPVVSKIVPSSGSVGVQMVRTARQARRIVAAAFSRSGRPTHLRHFRQKDYVYFQDFVHSDGYDIRAIVIGNFVFGYYREALKGDFRASGMNLVEKRALPKEAMILARRLNAVVKSPMLAVDMLHGLDGKYHIIEFSPFCQMDTPEQLHVGGVPGAYVFDDEETCRFEEGKWWCHELALKEYLITDYLPKMLRHRMDLPPAFTDRGGCLV